MKIAFNPSTVAALIAPPNNKDITFDLRGRNIFARGVKFCGTDTWRDIKINNVSIGSHTLDLRNGSNTTLTNTNGVVTINSTWRPVVDNLTSDSTTSSLSANQGRVLKALIDGKSNLGHTHDDRYLKLTGGIMQLGEGLKFHADENYFGTNADARIISLLDNNDKICDGGLIIDERATLDGKEYVTELLRIRDSEFKWKGNNILHSGNTYVSNNKGYINGLEITLVNNADTLDGAHLSDIKNWSDRTASAYWKAGWYKVASAQTATNIEAFLTLDVNAAKSNGHATLFIRKRADSKPYFICTHNNNLNLADFRLYYNGMSMVLYARVPNDWNGRVFRIISEGREGTYDHIWTLYSNVSSTDPNAISAEGGNPYINPTYSGRVDWSNSSDKANYANSAGSVAWNNVTGKPSSYIPSAHTHAWNSLTHSSTTENQAILTNGKANGWKLYTLNIARWDNAANNAHSHSNKSVLDGITSALVNNWNTAFTFVSTITGTDTDKVINKWDEIVNFLAGITEDNKLNTLLNSKLSVYKLANNTDVGAIKNNGIYYSVSDASSGTLTNSPFNTGFALINMTSYDGGDDLRRSRLAFNAYGEVKISNDRGLANTAETWYQVLTSHNTYISNGLGIINGTTITQVDNATKAGDADTLDSYHETAFFRSRGTADSVKTLWNNIGILAHDSSSNKPDGLNHPKNYYWGESLSFPGSNGMRLDIFANCYSTSEGTDYNNYGSGLFYRTGWSNTKLNWYEILDLKNYKAYINNTNFPILGHSHSEYVTSLSISGDYLAWSKGDVALTNLTIPYASKSKLLSAKSLITTTSTINNLNNIKAENSGIEIYTYKGNVDNAPTNITGDGELILINWLSGIRYNTLIAIGADKENIAFRWCNSADSWQSWKTLIHSGNYTSYTVKKDGTGASGTWSINISGNANTATSSTSSSYARNLLGRNTSGTDYGASDGNLVFAEYNTYSDNRWYLKAKGYETRVGYANNSDTVDGQHFSYSNSSNSPTYLWATNSNGSSFLATRESISVNYANSAGSATKVIVNLHIDNDANYPLVWSNLSNTNTVTENQLYKSWSDLYYNPKNKRLTVGGSIYAAHFYESSDKTLKKNIKSILSSTNIPKIREFDWKDTGEHSYGFIALELEELGYGCLVSEANGKKTVNYTATLALTVAKLLNLINIQNKKISNLTKELKALKYGRKKNS